MKSVLRAIRVLEIVSEHQPIAVGQLARLMSIPKTTAHRTLTTLGEAGLLSQSNGVGPEWEVSSRVLKIRPREFQGNRLYNAAHEPMAALRDAVNETIHLSVPDHMTWMVLIDRADCTRAVRTWSPIGDRSPITATSTGKAFLAQLPDEEIEPLIRGGLESFSTRTITDPDRFREQIMDIRKRGYSINVEENREGVAAIGAAVVDTSGRPVAGICISLPISRFEENRIEKLGELVSATAGEISGYAI